MPPKQSPEEQLSRIQEVLPEAGKHYSGEAIFVPTPEYYAKSLGLKSRGMLYAYGTNYVQKMEAVTGLTAIHNGLVLGDSTAIDSKFNLPKIEVPQPIEPLVRQIEALPDGDRARLLAQVAINPTKK